MKKSNFARMCSPRSGLKTAPLVNGTRCSLPRPMGVTLREVKPEAVTLKTIWSIPVGGVGRMSLKKPCFVPTWHEPFAVKMVTEKEAGVLARRGCRIRVVGTMAPSRRSASRHSVSSERHVIIQILGDMERENARRRKWASKLRKILRGLPQEDDGGEEVNKLNRKLLFDKRIDEEQMVKAFSEVYEGYCSKGLFNNEFKSIDLIAYLFVMVARYGYGRRGFSGNAQQPFYEFFTKRVAPDLEGVRGCTRESMGNRLRGKMEFLLQDAQKDSKYPAWASKVREKVEIEYKQVCGNFHKTEYGDKILKKFGK